MDNICDICNVRLSGRAAVSDHFQGKKHKFLESQRSCEVFAKNLPRNYDPSHLKTFFSKFGKIVFFRFSKDKQKVLVRYKQMHTARNIINRGVIYMGNKLAVLSSVGMVDCSNEFLPEDYKIGLNLQLLDNETSSFSEQLDVFLKYVIPTDKDFHDHELLVGSITPILSGLFPHCFVHQFGSTITGLSFKDSDIDIYVDVHQDMKQNTQADLILTLKRALGSNKNPEFRQIIALPNCRTPILKCTHILTDMDCDINFSSKLGFHNSQLIKYYVSLEENYRYTLLILKQWGKLRKLVRAGLTSYSLIMMFVFCMQHFDPEHVPSVYDLQIDPNYWDVKNGWNCGFQSKCIIRARNRTSVIELLLKFFAFYKDYDYATNVICPYLGKSLPRLCFARFEECPIEFHLYKQNQEVMPIDSPICAQDPFEHSRVITKNIAPSTFSNFVKACHVAQAALQEKDGVPPSLYKLFTCTTPLVPVTRKMKTVAIKEGIGSEEKSLQHKSGCTSNGQDVDQPAIGANDKKLIGNTTLAKEKLHSQQKAKPNLETVKRISGILEKIRMDEIGIVTAVENFILKQGVLRFHITLSQSLTVGQRRATYKTFHQFMRMAIQTVFKMQIDRELQIAPDLLCELDNVSHYDAETDFVLYCCSSNFDFMSGRKSARQKLKIVKNASSSLFAQEKLVSASLTSGSNVVYDVDVLTGLFSVPGAIEVVLVRGPRFKGSYYQVALFIWKNLKIWFEEYNSDFNCN